MISYEKKKNDKTDDIPVKIQLILPTRIFKNN